MQGKTGDSCEGKYILHEIFTFIKFKYKNALKKHFFKGAPVQSCPLLPYQFVMPLQVLPRSVMRSAIKYSHGSQPLM